MSTHARLSRSGPAVLRNRRIIIAYLLFTLAALLAPRVAEADLNPSTLPPDAETVLITEFVASPNSRENSNTLRDADGEASDWIELFNPSDSPIDLTGWRLTDRENDLRRWKFPNGVRIAAQGYLVVFASGKDRWEADGELHTNFSLKREGEYLALIDPNDNVVSDYGIPYPMQYTGVSYGVVEESGLPNRYGDLAHYMVQPTPGLPNGSAHGPVIRDVDHMPAPLTTGHDLRVSATVLADAPLVDVTLHYRIGYGDEQRIPMRSFIPSSYLADIPTRELPAGALVRYYITADLNHARNGLLKSHWPLPCLRASRLTPPAESVVAGALPEKIWLPAVMTPWRVQVSSPDYVRCPEYRGTVIDAAVVEADSDLPVLYWFVPHDPVYGWEWYRSAYDAYVDSGNPAWSFRDVGSTAALFYNGALYDNVYVRLGGAGTLVYSKKELEFEFNRDHELHLRGTEVEGLTPDSLDFDIINVTTTGGDESYIRQPLAWRAYAVAGVPASISFPLRLQENGAFFGVALFVEQPDVNYLRRAGLQEHGSFFKFAYNSLSREHFDPAREQLSGLRQLRPREIEREEALRELIEGINPASPVETGGQETADFDAVTTYLYDHVDIPMLINYMAVRTVLDDFDTTWHNFYLHQDLDIDPLQGDSSLWAGTGEWRFIPWDKDNILVARASYPPSGAHPFYGATGFAEPANALIDAVIRSPSLQAMYLRRLASVRDLLLGPDGGDSSWLGRHAAMFMATVAGDVAQDAQRWAGDAVAGNDAPIATFDATQLSALIARRWQELTAPAPAGFGDLIPDGDGTIDLAFGKLMLGSGPSRTAATVVNCGENGVDISGWTLTGGSGERYTFRPGVVIPAQGGVLYVTPDVAAFRADQRAARGEQILGLYVQGGFDADLLGNRDGGSFQPAPLVLEGNGRIVASSASPPAACGDGR